MKKLVMLPLALMFLLMVGSALHKPLAYDEYPNLYYGHQFLTEGPTAIPDGQRMPVLVFNALPCLSNGCDPPFIHHHEWPRFWVRFPTMLFTLFLGVLIYGWSRELYGEKAALGSLWLYALYPNFIAHGKQVTSDMVTSFFVTASVYLFWRYLKERDIKNWVLCALATAAGLVSKYSCLLLFPIFFLLWAIHRVKNLKPIPFSAGEVVRSCGRAVLFALIVLLYLNTAYLFRGSFFKAKDYPWESRGYRALLQSSSLRIPLPKVFARGMDYTRYLKENPWFGRPNNYILGRRHRKGRWYAFPIMVLLKTPLAFFLLLGIATRIKVRSEGFKIHPLGGLALGVPFAVWLFIFSVFCDVQVGIRYVLPALPFLFVYAGKSISSGGSPRRTWILGFLGGWYAISALSYHPHYLSYFNELIGGRINAYRYLADSNLDWEDKSYFLNQFKNEHPEIHFSTEPEKPTSGFVILGANAYVGVLDEERFKWVRENFKPLTHIAYSHLLFYVPPDRLKAIEDGLTHSSGPRI